MLGDKETPFRCSKLGELVKCSMKVHLMEAIELDDEGGEAAQNGSLTHSGVAAFHIEQGNHEQKKKAAWDAIAAHAAIFPLATINEVRLFITPYMNDRRNIEAQFYSYPFMPNEIASGKFKDRQDTLSIERQVDFTLEPHPLDTTGKLIHVQGTYDQIRKEPGGYEGWIPVQNDLKTGKRTGWEMIHDYAYQLCAYTHGCRQTIPIFKDLVKAKVIRNHGYRTRENKGDSPDGVFWAMPWDTIAKVELLLENVRLHVALWRNGEVNFGPGPHCSYCTFGGLPGCMPRWEQVQQLQLDRIKSAFTGETPQ